MKLIYILIFMPSLVFGQNIKLICEENSLIDYVDDKFINFEESNISEFKYTFNKELSFLKESYQDLNYDYMGEDKVSYHFRIETCLLYTSPSPRDVEESRMPSSA